MADCWPPFVPEHIEFQTHLMLDDFEKSQIGPRQVTISLSGKFLCVRTPVDITIVDLQNTTQRRKWFERSDLAHVNSSGGSIVANRGAVEVRIFPAVEQGMENVKEHTFPDYIVFLKWISDNVVAIVTSKAVYHWSTAEDQEPTKMFDRSESLSTKYTIIDYRTDATQKLLLLTGCRRGPEPLSSDGLMELYSVEDRRSMTIDGQAGTFEFKMDDSQEFSPLFCYVIRDYVKPRRFSPKSLAPLSKNGVSLPEFAPPETNLCRLHIELQESRHVIPVDFDPETHMNDYPVGIQVGPKYDVIYLMTRVGYVYVYLIESGVLLCKERVSESEIFVTAPHEPSSGIIAVNLEGQVFSVCVKEERFISYINNALGLHDIALRLANKHNELPGAEELIRLHQASQGLSSEHQKPSSAY